MEMERWRERDRYTEEETGGGGWSCMNQNSQAPGLRVPVLG